jgi:hypothetical protein
VPSIVTFVLVEHVAAFATVDGITTADATSATAAIMPSFFFIKDPFKGYEGDTDRQHIGGKLPINK